MDSNWRRFGGRPDQECEYEYEQEYEYDQESEWCGRATLDMRPLGRTPPGPPFVRGEALRDVRDAKSPLRSLQVSTAHPGPGLRRRAIALAIAWVPSPQPFPRRGEGVGAATGYCVGHRLALSPQPSPRRGEGVGAESAGATGYCVGHRLGPLTPALSPQGRGSEVGIAATGGVI